MYCLGQVCCSPGKQCGLHGLFNATHVHALQHSLCCRSSPGRHMDMQCCCLTDTLSQRDECPWFLLCWATAHPVLLTSLLMSTPCSRRQSMRTRLFSNLKGKYVIGRSSGSTCSGTGCAWVCCCCCWSRATPVPVSVVLLWLAPCMRSPAWGGKGRLWYMLELYRPAAAASTAAWSTLQAVSVGLLLQAAEATPDIC